jgi:hypothetical protein
MRAEEFISVLSEKSGEEAALRALRNRVPLGVDALGEIVYSQNKDHPYTVKNTCVTGARRTTFIRKLLLTLSCLYEKDEANFFLLSPRAEYGELLKLQNADVTVPFVREKADLESAVACLKELVSLYRQGTGFPKLILVLDGLEELENCNAHGDFEEYREILDLLARETNVEVIVGADLMKSIFSGDPGVFVGVGNCLVTTREEGRADVTYVGNDCSLSLPTMMEYPQTPSVTETMIFLNSLATKRGEV